jgi:hypothetical protein
MQDELKCAQQWHYFIDGSSLHLTDLSKCLMPPPISMLQRHFESNIVAVSKSGKIVLVVTESKVHLLDLSSNQIEQSLERGEL